MKFRKTQWLDTKKHKAVYGIKASHPDIHDGKFLNAMFEGKPLLFDDAEERYNKIKELKELYKK